MASEADTLRAVGHGVLSLVNAAILLAILAVFVSPSSQAPGMIQQAFALLAWLVGQVINPITGGSVVNLSATDAPAGAYPSTATGTGGTTSTGTTPSTGGTGGAVPPTQALISLCDTTTGQWTGYAQPGTDPSLFPPGSKAC